MDVVYRRRAVVEFCPKKEYLEQVIEQFKIVRRIREMEHDRLFAAAVEAMWSRVKLVEGDYKRVSFRFSIDGRKHHRGPKYILSWKGNLFKDVNERASKDEDGFYELSPEPRAEVDPIETLTADGLLDGINLIAVQEVLEL